MKHLVTLIQVICWIIVDLIMAVYYLEWNKYRYAPGYTFKKCSDGVVRYATNYDKRSGVKYYRNKYKAAFSK